MNIVHRVHVCLQGREFVWILTTVFLYLIIYWLRTYANPHHHGIMSKSEVQCLQIGTKNLKCSKPKWKLGLTKMQGKVFKPGNKVLAFISLPDDPLQVKYYGPYEIKSKFSDINCIIKTTGRCRVILVYHIYMWKSVLPEMCKISLQFNLC